MAELLRILERTYTAGQTKPPTCRCWTGTSTAFDYSYDARSRLTGITRSATDKVNWTYNTAGLVTSEVTTIPQVTSALGASSVTSTMNYAYDTAGRTTSKSL
ncbi:MAG: hypothetical protein ACK5PB_00620, partial [Pirellula sp.]